MPSIPAKAGKANSANLKPKSGNSGAKNEKSAAKGSGFWNKYQNALNNLPLVGKNKAGLNKEVKKSQVSTVKEVPERAKSFPKNTNGVYYPKSQSPLDAESKTSKMRVFKPSDPELIRQKISTGLGARFGKKRTFSFGFKPLELLQRPSKLDWFEIWKNLNLQITRARLVERFNRLVAIMLFAVLVFFVLYLSFFDRYFLIKSYLIRFSPNSYLSQKETNFLLEQFSKNKILGLFPSNQYWFLSDQNLTFLAQKTIPEIESVRVTQRSWPNKVELEVTVRPPLVTLMVVENNQPKYWRIGSDGRVVSEDDANLRENLVYVERSITFDKPNVTLQDYPIFNDPRNLNRLYFTVTAWEYLREYDIKPVYTVLPSLVDSDVVIQTDTGTRLLFDANFFDRETQKQRLQVVFGSQLKNRERAGELAYIDFRISRKIFICKKGQVCEKEV